MHNEGNIIATNIIVREWVLGGTLIITACMISVFLIFVGKRAKDFNYHVFNKEFYRSDWTRAMIGLITFISGVSMRAGWVWAILWNYEKVGKTGLVVDYWGIDVVAGMFTALGGLCVVREFTPVEWNKWPFLLRPWVVTAELTALFLAFVHLVI